MTERIVRDKNGNIIRREDDKHGLVRDNSGTIIERVEKNGKETVVKDREGNVIRRGVGIR